MVMGRAAAEGLTWLVAALTPTERWRAARQFSSSPLARQWFVLIALVALVLLAALLVWVRWHRKVQGRKTKDRYFVGQANLLGLSDRERQILLAVANRAGLTRSDAIFTMEDAFDKGASVLLKEIAGTRSAEYNERVREGLSYLREKLGFQPSNSPTPAPKAKTGKLHSRQISVGKNLRMTRYGDSDTHAFEASVIANDNVGIAVRLNAPLESEPGELWRVRCHSGASVWEFDTSVVSCNGDRLVLDHTADVRFVNRRRFLRVPVNKPAFIARFPFAVTLPLPSGKTAFGGGRILDTAGSSWGPPEFVPAVVTELAGPGLRIEHIQAPLELKVGDRVLVVFRLSDVNEHDSGSEVSRAAPAPRIVEDIGQVRQAEAVKDGYSLAVELLGLSDSDVNELIRAANSASSKVRAAGQGDSDAVSDREDAEAETVQPAEVQGT